MATAYDARKTFIIKKRFAGDLRRSHYIIAAIKSYHYFRSKSMLLGYVIIQIKSILGPIRTRKRVRESNVNLNIFFFK